MKIAFIGGGNMAEAMLAAILGKGIGTPDDIQVSDIKKERLDYLAQAYGVSVSESNRVVVESAGMVILAIKPQNLAEVMAQLNGQLKPAQLVLSIIAGARIDTLCRGLNHDCVVRVMPNTPAQIGQGMSVWTATASVSDEQKELVGSILRAMGKEIKVDDEAFLNKATAVSGSGPAYFFLFVEALVEAAVSLGFSGEVALELVRQTVLGSSLYLKESGRSPSELRRMVTSPGGTTAEALLKFEEGRFSELVRAAVQAAYRRARELGQ